MANNNRISLDDIELARASDLYEEWAEATELTREGLDYRRQAVILAKIGRVAIEIWERELQVLATASTKVSDAEILQRRAEIRAQVCRDDYVRLVAEGEIIQLLANRALEGVANANAEAVTALTARLDRIANDLAKVEKLAQEAPKFVREAQQGNGHSGSHSNDNLRVKLEAIEAALRVTPLHLTKGQQRWHRFESYLRDGAKELLKAPFTIAGLLLVLFVVSTTLPFLLQGWEAFKDEVLHLITLYKQH